MNFHRVGTGTFICGMRQLWCWSI